MEIHLYKTSQVCKFLCKASIVIVFVLFGLKGQSQGVISNLTYGNQIQLQLPLFPCEGNLLLSAEYTSQIANDTLILFYPNTFQIDSIFPGTVITNFANGFISLRIPLNSLVDTLDFSFSYINCLASEYSIDSNINSSNLIFQCYLQSLPSFAAYNYNGVPLIPSPNIPAFVTFTSATVPPIEIISGLNANSTGIANEEYFRYFDVVINTPALREFTLSVSQESDVEYVSFFLIDADSANVLMSDSAIVADTVINVYEYTLNLDSLTDYLFVSGTTTTLRFKQRVKLLCGLPSGIADVVIQRNCCSTTSIAQISLNGYINEGQLFTISDVDVVLADTSSDASCATNYYYDITFSKAGEIAYLDSLFIPLNYRYFSSIDSIILIDTAGISHLIDSIPDVFINTLDEDSTILYVDLRSAYDSLANWQGFQFHRDTAAQDTAGPWFGGDNFTIRIAFQYNCFTRRSCFPERLYLNGRDSINGIYQKLPVNLRWLNTCQSLQYSSISTIELNDSPINPNLILTTANPPDLVMGEANQVSINFNPNFIRPFLVRTGQDTTDLSCDTSITYRAEFTIPLPETAVDTFNYVPYSITGLTRNFLPITVINSSVLFSDSASLFIDSTANELILSIPLGVDLYYQSVLSSFHYDLNTCIFPNPPNSGGIDLTVKIKASCNACPDCYRIIDCGYLDVIVHCPGECGGNVPLGTETVDIQRSTFGWRDTLDYPSDAIANIDEFIQYSDSLISSQQPSLPQTFRETLINEQLKRVYPFDLVNLKVKGHLTSYANLDSAGVPFRFNKIAFEVAHTPVGELPLLALKQGELYFLDDLGDTLFDASLQIANVNPINTMVFGMDGDTLYSFELIVENLEDLMSSHTEINTEAFDLELNAEFWVLPDTVSGFYPITMRGQFVCGTNVDGSITNYSCDSWGTSLQVVVPKITVNSNPISNDSSYCNTSLKYTVLTEVTNFPSDPFPYEIRPLLAWPDSAYADLFETGFGISSGDTLNFTSDSLSQFTNPTDTFLLPPLDWGNQSLVLSSLKNCVTGSDTIKTDIRLIDFAYINDHYGIDSLLESGFSGTGTVFNIDSYAFYDSLDTVTDSLHHIQHFELPNWIYTSGNPFIGLLPGYPAPNVMQGIAQSDSLHFNLYVHAPDSSFRGNCWLSHRFSDINNSSVFIPTNVNYSLDSIPQDSLTYISVTDTLNEVYHLFPQGFPSDTMLLHLSMPVNCGNNIFRLTTRYGCFCRPDSFEIFKDTLLLNGIAVGNSCAGGSSIANFKRQGASVELNSELIANIDTSGCDLTWHVSVNNLLTSPNLHNGQLLISIPSGLVLDPQISTFEYISPGDTSVTSFGDYTYNDSIPPSDYTFEFMEFPTPPTTVLVLSFPSIDTLESGGLINFFLRFKIDEGTCDLNQQAFTSYFLNRYLEARFVAFAACNDSVAYASPFIQQILGDENQPGLVDDIINMSGSEDCCLSSAATISYTQPCNQIDNGIVNFHLSGENQNHLQFYKENPDSGYFAIEVDTLITDSLYSISVEQGLYSAIVTTSGGLIYVFNSIIIQNHGVQAHLNFTQPSLCAGSEIELQATDSNVVNYLPYFSPDSIVTLPLTYYWSSNATADSLNPSQAISVPFADTTFSVIINHYSGCSDTSEVSITTNELLNEYSILVNPTICSNQIAEIEILPDADSLSTFQLYLYNADSSIVDTLLNQQLIASHYPMGEYSIELNYFNDSNCIEKYVVLIKIDSVYCTCNCSDDSLAVQVYIPSNVVSGDSLQTFIEGIEYQVSCYVISNNIIVDNSISLSNVSLKFKAGTELLIENTGVVYFNNVELSGCDTLWRGIRNEGVLKFNVGSISDAQFGIFTQRQGLLPILPATQIKSIEFQKNYIGLEIPNQLGGHALKMESCSFSGGHLLPDYIQQNPPTISDGGIAGIRVENFSLSIPSGTVFKGLDNGVIARKSKVVATKPYFLNIQPYANYSNPQYGLQSIKSAAINAVVGSDVILYGAGTDEDDSTPYIFEGCQFGAYTFKSYLNMTNCKIGATDNNFPSFVGVLSEGSSYNKGFYLHDNRIRSYGVGIGVFMANSLNHKYGDIVNNNIAIVSTFDSSQTDLSSGFQETGIMVNTFVDGGKIFIDSNLVSLRSATSTYSHGIYALNTRGLYVLNNQIFRQTVNHGIGVQVTNSPYAQVLCNQSEAIDTTQESYSFQIDACPNVNIQNNQSDNSKYGFNFNLNNIGSRIAKNTIRTHGKYGLWIGVNGTVGQQPHRWNRWLSNATTEIQAYRQNDTSAVGNNLFIVEFGVTDPNFDYYPPVHDPFLIPCTADNFFQCATDNESVEAVDCFATGSTIQGIIIDNGGDEENAIKIADKLAKEEVEYELYEDETIYSLKKSIDALQKDSTLFLPDTASFPTFKSEIASTNIPKLNQVNENLRRIELDTAISENLDALKTLILNKYLELFVLDSLLLGDIEQNSISVSLLSQRELLEDSIDYLDNEMQLMLSNIESIRMSNVDSANSKNNSVSAENDLESHERTINAIYIETIERDIFVFNASQKQSIEYIAGLCPLLGGEAVFKARSLLSLYNFNFIFDDHNLCLQQGLQYRISKQDGHNLVLEAVLKVYPNPTSRSVTVDLQSELEGTFNLRILSLTGQTVYELNSTLNKNTIDLESVNLSQGIYLVELRHNLTTQTFRTRFVYGN